MIVSFLRTHRQRITPHKRQKAGCIAKQRVNYITKLPVGNLVNVTIRCRMHPAFNDIYSALGACLPCCVIILSQNSIKGQVLIIPGRKCPCRCDLQEIIIFILPANDVKTYMKTQKSVLLIPSFEKNLCKCFMNIKKAAGH